MSDSASLTRGHSMYRLVEALYPICRSITGAGTRESLDVLERYLDLPVTRTAVPTGTPVFDWQVPREWYIEDAYVENADGYRVIDFRAHNLHVLNYSTPIDTKLSLEELQNKVHTLPDQPSWIPYRTSYYKDAWGFCAADEVLKSLPTGDYHAVIKSAHSEGSLDYAETFLPGERSDEFLVFSHICHPSLANDNLSGMAVTATLARELAQRPRRFSYRFVWAPGTIGSITWLARNHDRLSRVKGGLVAVLLGDRGHLRYKPTRFGDHRIDRILTHVVEHSGGERLPFDPYGYDERQFASPGIRLPMGRLTRSHHGAYAEYHSSADNLQLISPGALEESLEALLSVVEVFEHDRTLVSMSPYCEPQLGRRGLYRPSGGGALPDREYAMLWTLNQCDGDSSLLDVAETASLPFSTIRQVSDELLEAELLAEQPVRSSAPEASS